MAASKPITPPPSRRDAVGTGRYRTIEAGRGRALTGGWRLHRWVETPRRTLAQAPANAFAGSPLNPPIFRCR